MRKKEGTKSAGKRILLTLFVIILIPVLAAGALVGYLMATEYQPEQEEVIEIARGAEETMDPKMIFTVMTWNIGYADLGDYADFFMDKGTKVINSTEEKADFNLTNIISQIRYQHPDLVFVQELDRNSRRSYYSNQAERMMGNLDSMDYVFANNYLVEFVPFPWPPIGKVDAGLLMGSRYQIDNSTRYQLPVPFKWPISLANLKRCITLSRIPIDGMDKELVAINLHLEAYDHGEGKIEQTRMLKAIMDKEREAGNYVIAGGDFNQSFSSVDNSMYPSSPDTWQPGIIEVEEFGDGWQFVMDNRVPTCRSLDRAYVDADKESFQYYMIDGFILSDNVEVIDVETKDMGFQYSDHNPVIAKLKLKR